MEKVARAARDILGDVRVYVIGGVAENRTTALSDIDVLIAVSGRIDAETEKGYTSK